MTKRMLIDATHAEETRVVVLDGNRLEDFDVESSAKKQLKGNIYLAKVVRVEPSLQAAFVEYGGGRHGFLAFGEIHPDYYQIPVADRQRLLAMQAEEARAAEDDEDDAPAVVPGAQPAALPSPPVVAALDEAEFGEVAFGAVEFGSADPGGLIAGPAPDGGASPVTIAEFVMAGSPAESETVADAELAAEADATPMDVPADDPGDTSDNPAAREAAEDSNGPATLDAADAAFDDEQPAVDAPAPETFGGESDTFEGNGAEEARQRRSARFLRNYRIQEVIRRRQIMLIQVVKEERGTKGAALTTYISLAGRFCVLMPNSPRGGGISRKITSAADRRRLKEITAELEIPAGMGLIVRTAGAARPKPEIKRDCEYLMRLWDDIRDHTMQSMAPALIYEEASLIKRTIRDVYSRDVDEVLVDGQDGWKAAHDFMRMLMPSHAKKVQLWRADVPGAQPLFVKHQVEAQLDAMLSPTVQLKSGGYLVINQTEALVAIDVNSGRSTRERGIEETALKTNLEAADEVARQLRLRDLAGLIVIDLIDMESKKHNAMVERRLKEALKNDRARIQVGYISHFGLLEMSRQRLRPSLTETNFVACPHCGGIGHVRSIESSTVHVLRGIEEEGAKDRASLIMVHAAPAVVMYILNNKRDRLAEIEARYAMRVQFAGDDSLVPPGIRIDRLRAQLPPEERVAAPVAPAAPVFSLSDEDVADEEMGDEDMAEEGDLVEAVLPPSARANGQQTLPADIAADDGSGADRDGADADGVEVAGNGSAEARAAAEETRKRRRRRRRGTRREPGETGPDTPAEVGATVAEDQAGQTEVGGAAEDVGGEFAAGDVAAPDVAAGDVAAGDNTAGAEQPGAADGELDENGEPKGRRRGRRGGRRRRRDAPGEEVAAEGAGTDGAAAAPAPAYAGPTPADPFGGQTMDIFDMIDMAAEEDLAFQKARAARAVPEETVVAPAEAELAAPETAEAGPGALEAVVVEHAEPEPDAGGTGEVEPVTTGRLGSAVVDVAEDFTPPDAAPPIVQASLDLPPDLPDDAVSREEPDREEREIETVAAASTAIRPIVIGVDQVPEAAPKKGWWRR